MACQYHLEMMRHGFINMLKTHADRPPSWYNIQHFPSLSSQNLSHYLGFEEKEYHEVLLALGFAKLRRGKIQMQRNAWDDLVAALGVSCPILVEKKWHALSKGMLYIRLGRVPKLGEIHKPAKEPSTVKKWTCSALERHKLLGEGSVSDHSKVLYAVEKLSEIEMEEKAAEEESRYDEAGEEGEECDSSEVQYDDGERTINVDSSQYPYLGKANLTSFKPSVLYGLLRDIVGVSKEYPNEFKMEFQLKNNERRELIIVPKVTTEASFRKNARPVLERMIDGLISDSFCKKKARTDGMNINLVRGDERKAITRQVIDHYFISYPDIVQEVANDHGINFDDRKMDKHYAAAMFCESGIGPGKARIINRYLTAFFNRRLMAPESEIFRDKDLALDELPPEIKVEKMPDKTKLTFYVKPLDKIISLGLKKKLKNTKEGDEQNINRIDISWSADHGGGFFRAIVRCSAAVQGKKLTFSHRVGQMQCKSDKYDIVERTMGKYLNSGIKKLLENDGRTPKAMNIYINENDEDKYFYISPHGSNDFYNANDEYTLVYRVPSNRIYLP